MSKFDDDLRFGMENRLEVSAQLSKNGIYLMPVHPTLDLSGYLNFSKKEKNIIINRLMDTGTENGMGLDFELFTKGKTEKIRTLIRWFSDPDVYIKNASDANILPCYSEAIILYTNIPLKDKKGIVRYYNLFPFSFLKEKKWKWINSKRKGEGNKNRIILVTNTGTMLKPCNFSHYPINGNSDIFFTNPDIWTKFKSLSK